MSPWVFLRNNAEDISLLGTLVIFLNFFLNLVNLYRTRQKKDLIKFGCSQGEYHRFKRGTILRGHLKIDFNLTALNSDAYVKQISISKGQSFGSIQLPSSLPCKGELLNIKNVCFYLRNWGGSPSITQEGWEYNVSPTPELPFNKILLDNQIQYRSISGSRENHDNFRDAWGRISLSEWTDLKSPLLIEENSRRHVTILCEITFNEDMEGEVCKMFSNEKPIDFDIRILFNSTKSVDRVKLQPSRIG